MRKINKSHLFPLIFKHLTHHKVMLLNPTAVLGEKPVFAANQARI